MGTYERVGRMDYKQKIIEMVEKINNEDYLFKIYHYILAKYKRSQKEEGD